MLATASTFRYYKKKPTIDHIKGHISRDALAIDAKLKPISMPSMWHQKPRFESRVVF